MGAKVLIF